MKKLKLSQTMFLVAMITLSILPFASAAESVEAVATVTDVDGFRERDGRMIDPTTLYVELVVVGDATSDGSTFSAIAHVTNIGRNTAMNVEGRLKGTWPEGWVISPLDRTQLGDILPGETKSIKYEITRDSKNAVIGFVAKGENTREATSERVKAPINALIMAGAAISMVGLAAVRRKEKKI